METKIRNSNIELLRIISMLMIISCHIVSFIVYDGQSITTNSLSFYKSGINLNRYLIGLFSAEGRIGVAIFFIISGYFLINKEHISIDKVVIKTFFYSIITSFIYFAFITITHSKNNLELKESIKTLFVPITHGHYWFITIYIYSIVSK